MYRNLYTASGEFLRRKGRVEVEEGETESQGITKVPSRIEPYSELWMISSPQTTKRRKLLLVDK